MLVCINLHHKFWLPLVETALKFLNIERTRMWSSIGDRILTPYLWCRTNEHRTSNLIELSLDLLNYSSNKLELHFFEHQTNSNMFIDCWSNSNTLFLASNNRTSNFEYCSTHHYFEGFEVTFSWVLKSLWQVVANKNHKHLKLTNIWLCIDYTALIFEEPHYVIQAWILLYKFFMYQSEMNQEILYLLWQKLMNIFNWIWRNFVHNHGFMTFPHCETVINCISFYRNSWIFDENVWILFCYQIKCKQTQQSKTVLLTIRIS